MTVITNSAAERMRRFRERQKLGIAMTVPVQVFTKEIDRMVDKKLLQATKKDDRMSVITAIEDILDEWFEG